MTEIISTQYFTPLRRVEAVQRIPDGMELRVDDAIFQIVVLSADLLRLRISRSGIFDETPTFAVCANLSDMSAPFEILEDDDTVQLRTDALVLSVGRSPFRVDARRADGSVIFETAAVNGQPWPYAYLNDEFFVVRASLPADPILGLGEKTGRFNRNGRNFTLWNVDVLSPDASGEFTAGRDAGDPRGNPTSTEFDPYYVSIPFFSHLDQKTGDAAGFFIDNGYRGHFEFGHTGQYRFHFDGGQYTEYVFAGPSLKDILSAYTGLTGRMPAPPLWALGYHHCRWHPYAQKGVEALAERYRDKRLPCDALWLDIDYMDGYRVFTWNKDDFPDVPGMLERLGQQGLRTITIIDPGVKAEPGYEVYDDGVAQDVFCKTEGGNIYTGQVWPGKTAFPDFVTPEGRRWWGERNAAHIKSGLAGIWNDMNEPATGDIPAGGMRFDGGRGPHERYHNQYGLLMAMGTREGLLAAIPDRRTFILSRSGFAGIQRYAANWMGDNMARWDHLEMSVPMALGLGLSGQPFVGADIGGFAANSNPELLVRWMQCGVLTPFCRHHNNAGCIDQYPWSFGKVVEELCRRSLELRYRLMPTLYAAFREAAEMGLPVQRPLALEWQSDVTTHDCDDEYLLGPHLLAAPVCAPGMTARQVYLPEGTWHHWFTGETFIGPRFIIAQTPMDYIPLYVQGGAVIPMWPDAPLSTMDYHPRMVELHVFIPEKEGEWTSCLYEDDGLTFAFQEGAQIRTDFCVRRMANVLTLEATATGRGYSEFAREEFAVIFHGLAPVSLVISGSAVTLEGNQARFQNSGASFHLEARLAA